MSDQENIERRALNSIIVQDFIDIKVRLGLVERDYETIKTDVKELKIVVSELSKIIAVIPDKIEQLSKDMPTKMEVILKEHTLEEEQIKVKDLQNQKKTFYSIVVTAVISFLTFISTIIYNMVVGKPGI